MSKRTGNPNGRPPKNTPANFEAIIRGTREHGFRNVAAAAAGISESLLYEWIAEGRKADGRAEFVEFVEKLDQAEALWKIDRLTRIRKKGGPDGDKWALACKDKATFGRSDKIEVAGADGGALRIVLEFPKVHTTEDE